MNRNKSIMPVVLAGGVGSRLWPLSRMAHPKQFQCLYGDNSLFQDTVTRVKQELFFSEPIVICHKDYRFIVAEQLREIGVGPANIILEPCQRNTAPAITLAALQVLASGTNPTLLVMPADHVIKDKAGFIDTVERALSVVNDGYLVTFGIKTTKAETGYGYIELGASLLGNFAYQIKQFIEKPNELNAIALHENKNYYWNSGIFLFKASVYIGQLKNLSPDIYAICQQAMNHKTSDLGFTVIDADSFSRCPNISIDYAVMEKTAIAAVAPIDVGWSDIGSWSSLMDINEVNEAGNVLRGKTATVATENCYLHSTSRLLTTVGVKDHIIVETDDAVLVAHKDANQSVKQLVETLITNGVDEATEHRKVFRPWGHYETLIQTATFKVKKIYVKPGCSLSLQQHTHRAEHWIVVAGEASIVNGEASFRLATNQSTYIPPGTKHRLTNDTQADLELIEVQTGTYLGEDDIIRFADTYGRK